MSPPEGAGKKGEMLGMKWVRSEKQSTLGVPGLDSNTCHVLFRRG